MTRELPMFNKFIDMWYNRLNHDDQDIRIIITGDTGLGKSERAVGLGYDIDPNFNVNGDYKMEKVIMDSYTFLETVSNIRGKDQKGGFFIGDELGLWASNRDWAKPMNKALSAIFQGGRYKNLGLAMTVPSMDLIDSQLRGLFHYYLEVIDLRKKTDVALCVLQEIQKNKKTGRLYFKYPRGYVNGRLVVVDHVWITRCPDQEINKAYQKKKAERMDIYYEERNADVLKDREHRAIDYQKPRDISLHVAKCLENLDKIILHRKNGNPYLSLHDIEAVCGIGGALGSRTKAALMRNTEIMVKLGIIDEYEQIINES